MIIEYYRKSTYGNNRLYVKDEEQARYITGITGMKTIDERIMACFNYLGITFKEVIAPRKGK